MTESVLVAMSGGVDSSVAAAVLVQEGYEVVGITMRMHDSPHARGARHGCCTVEDADDAKAVAARLGIDHYTVDVSDRFSREVLDTFVAGYAAGHTPNPCVECNRNVKFDELVARADALGIDHVATGHHARLEDRVLLRGVDAAKDQSYVLACLSPLLKHRVKLPVGGLTKARVRQIAAGLGLRTADKAESMEVCFLGPGGLAEFLTSRLDTRPGPVVDEAGGTVGSHRGAHLYTVGQRRGFETSRPGRRFVQSVHTASNTLVVGPRPPRAAGLRTGSPNWLVYPPEDFVCEVQTSAHGAPVEAVVVEHTDDVVSVEFVAPAPMPAVGQLAAFYAGDVVLGGATIVETEAAFNGCTRPGSAGPGT